ncbi:hypothetical protein SCP_0200460 [Sparassis crispa]|uniref:Uncharacterized protein n=1 Tax=Sparassis crispa TaxID=139825 RepID=A0A401G9M5_9APHY|nr:hypothetical protein SCP_0200460 [Sparassis crispa]GBE78849.1 hypothetical protein SCP_0200460 [Sparassis crispa]
MTNLHGELTTVSSTIFGMISHHSTTAHSPAATRSRALGRYVHNCGESAESFGKVLERIVRTLSERSLRSLDSVMAKFPDSTAAGAVIRAIEGVVERLSLRIFFSSKLTVAYPRSVSNSGIPLAS